MSHQAINLSTILFRCLFTDVITPPCCLTSASSIKSLRLSFSLFSSHLARFTQKKVKTKDAQYKKNIVWEILASQRTLSQILTYVIFLHIFLILLQLLEQIFQFQSNLFLVRIMLQLPLLYKTRILCKQPWRRKICMMI